MAFDEAPGKKLNSAQRNAGALGAVYEKMKQAETFEEVEEVEDVEGFLDSEAGIDNIMTAVEDLVLDRLVSSSEAAAEFGYTEAFNKLDELEEKLSEIKAKLHAGEEVTDEDYDSVQAACDAVEAAAAAESELDNVDAAAFDPDSYVTQQFSEHPYLIPSQRSPVYLLQREYRRAVKEGATQDAEELAQQIKEHVDELVGNDMLPQEGVGYDLSPVSRKETGLRITSLDQDTDESILIDSEPVILAEPDAIPEKLQSTATPGIDFSSASRYNEEIAQDLKETQQVIENLKALTPEPEDVDDEPETTPVPENVYSQEQRELDDQTYGDPIDLEAVSKTVSTPELMADVFDAEVVEPSEDEVDMQLETNPAPVSFTPESVATQAPEGDKDALDSSINELALHKQALAIESEGGNFWDRLLGVGPSPYETCGDELFTEFMGNAGAWKINMLLQRHSIHRDVYDRWYTRRDEIIDVVEDVEGKSFKEVVDEYLLATASS